MCFANSVPKFKIGEYYSSLFPTDDILNLQYFGFWFPFIRSGFSFIECALLATLAKSIAETLLIVLESKIKFSKRVY